MALADDSDAPPTQRVEAASATCISGPAVNPPTHPQGRPSWPRMAKLTSARAMMRVMRRNPAIVIHPPYVSNVMNQSAPRTSWVIASSLDRP
jgi:hypothetical protein